VFVVIFEKNGEARGKRALVQIPGLMGEWLGLGLGLCASLGVSSGIFLKKSLAKTGVWVESRVLSLCTPAEAHK
jgi:hypothetical protein